MDVQEFPFSAIERRLPIRRPMTQQGFEFHVNPSDDTIRVGPLTVRFLVTAADSSASIAAFELTVPGGHAC
jgi:hypothetical protein